MFNGGLEKSLTMFYPSWQSLYGVSNTEVTIVFAALGCSTQLGGFLSRFTVKKSIRIVSLCSVGCKNLTAQIFGVKIPGKISRQILGSDFSQFSKSNIYQISVKGIEIYYTV